MHNSRNFFEIFGDSSYPLFSFIVTEFSGDGNIQEQSFSAINGLVHISQLSFGTLKARFICLQRAMDIKVNIFP